MSHSYTTVRVDPDGKTVVDVTLRPDRGVFVLCPQGHDRAQLSISHGRADVLIMPSDPVAPTAADVDAARKLAEMFARYAAEVERLHALNGASTPGVSAESAA